MKNVHLTPKELAIVKDILQQRKDAVLFGSRVAGTNKKFSDLDVCLKDPITGYELELLKEAFENSDLSFKVDLVEYHRLSDHFKNIIDTEGILFSDVT